MENIARGKAYGFIKCNKPKAQIEALMPAIRGMARTPSDLEISIVEGINNVKGDKLLHETVVRDLIDEGQCNYAFEAASNTRDSESTAREVKDVFNQAYQSPLFEPRPDNFYATVVYEQNGQYVNVSP